MDVRAYVESHAREFIDDLKQWLAIPSISADPAHHGDVRRSAEWLAAHLHTIGFPVAEIWEDPDNPEPRNADEQRTEDEIRNAGERRDSAEDGYPAIEVRVTCGSRHEAVELSERLDQEGIANVHRWSWVLIGARDEDDGHAIAERLRGELPGAEIAVESNLRAVWDSRPGNPFAWLGGLAG